MWDQVDCDFEGETLKLSGITNHQIANCRNMFETRTVAKVFSSENVTKTSKICGTSGEKYVALAIDDKIYIFCEDFSAIYCTLKLENSVDCLCASSEPLLLIIGENNGTVHIFNVLSQKKIVSFPVMTKDDTISGAFKGIIVTTNKDKLKKICILTANNNLHIFSDIDFDELNKAAEEELLNEFIQNVQKRQICISEAFKGFVPLNIFESSCDVSRPIGLVGSYIAGNESNDVSTAPLSDPSACGISIIHHTYPGVNILKAYSSNFGRDIICMDSKQNLIILCGTTHTLKRTWGDGMVRDLSVCELESTTRSGCMNIKIGVILQSSQNNAEEKCHFQLLQYPDLNIIYCLEVGKLAVLLPCERNQDNMYMIEGEYDSELCEFPSSAKVKSVVEATSEARFNSLLRKRKFTEAEEFANSHQLDCQIINESKIHYLFQDLSNGNGPDNFAGALEELQSVLWKMKDVAYIKALLNISLPSLWQTKSCLELCRKWIQKKSINGRENAVLLSKINEAQNKITTFEILHEYNWDKLEWRAFLSASLLSLLLSELQSGCILIANFIWRRHQAELLQNLSLDNVKHIFSSIPDSVPSKNLTSFLQTDFLLPVLQISGVMDVVTDWLRQRTCSLELTEEENWPVNGRDLVDVFFNMCETSIDTSSVAEFAYTQHIQLYSIHALSQNKQSPVGRLAELRQNLKDLILLRNEYDCKLNLSEYTNENKSAVFEKMLDMISVPHLVPALSTFIRDFLTQHQLDFNNCLLQYIKDVLQKTPYKWWHCEEAPWEKRLLTIVSWIQDCSHWIDGVISIVCSASIPWSDAVKKFIQAGMELEHPKSDVLKNQCRLVQLKTVLKKYELFDFNGMEDYTLAEGLSRYILRQEKPSAIEDVLCVYATYEKLNKRDAYMTVFRHMLDKDEISEIMNILSTLPHDLSITCCKNLLLHVQHNLDNEYVLQLQPFLCRTLAQVGVRVVKFLTQWKEPFDQELATLIQSSAELQSEFGMFVKISSLSCESICWKLIETAIDSVFEGKAIVIQDLDRKGSSTRASVDDIYRLGHILHMEKEEIMAKIVSVFAKQNEFDKAIFLCRELSDTFTNQTTADTLIKIVKHLCCHFHDFENMDLSTVIVLIHDLVSKAVNCCGDEHLKIYEQLWKFACTLVSIRRIMLEAQVMSDLDQSPYVKWMFGPIYNNEGLWVDSSIAALLFSESFVNTLTPDSSVKPFSSSMVMDIMTRTQDLVNHLDMKGQEITSIHVAMYAVSCLIPYSLDLNAKEFSLVTNSVSDMLRQASKATFPKVMLRKSADLPFLLSILSVLTIGEAKQLFQKQYRLATWQVFTLYSVAIEYSLINNQINVATEFRKSWNKLSWFTKHAKSTLTAEEIFQLDKEEEKSFVKSLISSKSIDTKAIISYCEVSKLDNIDLMVHSLKCLLISVEVAKWQNLIELPLKDVNVLLRKAEEIITALSSDLSLYKVLQSILRKASPYYYEVLLFVHENLIKTAEKMNLSDLEIHKKGILLLKFLMVYKRVAPPLEAEIEYWRNHTSAKQDNTLPAIAGTRLPFHPFLVKSIVHKFINPELTANTIDVWLTVSPILNLSADQLIMIAVKNTVNTYIRHQELYSKSTTIISSKPDVHLLSTLHKLLHKIEDPELQVACATSVTKLLPSGANKTMLAKRASHLAATHASSFPNSSVLQNISAIHQKLTMESVLYKHDLVSEENFAHVGHPDYLVMHLIENCQLPVSQSVKVCDAIQEISKQVSFNVTDTYFSFLSRWLTPTQIRSGSLDDSFLIQDDKTEKYLSIDKRNLKKAVAVALGIPERILTKLLKSINEKFKELSYKHQFHAMCCILSVSSPQIVREVTGIGVSELVEELKELSCVTEIESLRLPYSQAMFKNCEKEEMVKRLLLSHSSNSKALLCCTKICLIYKIWCSQVWTIILKNMKDMFMMEELFDVLNYGSGSLSHMWDSQVFIDAWQSVVISSFGDDTSADPKTKVEKACIILSKCPCYLYLDPVVIWNKAKEFGLVPTVADCDTEVPSSISELISKLKVFY